MSGLREIISDYEMTGLGWTEGHRIIEASLIEMIDKNPTGRVFQSYFNPQRPVDPAAFAVHKLSNEFLADKPLFAERAATLRDFIGGTPLIITCRTFDGQTLDIDCLNGELEKSGLPIVPLTQWVNVRRWGETMFGADKARLDDMLDHYGINRQERDDKGHGGGLDAALLARIYPRLSADYARFNDRPRGPRP